MPLISYRCSRQRCNHEFDNLQSFSEPDLTECPKCEKISLQRQITAFNVDCGGRTLGTIAEKNTARATETERNRHLRKTGQLKPKKPKPWWRDSDKPLNLNKVKNVDKYIRTGEKT